MHFVPWTSSLSAFCGVRHGRAGEKRDLRRTAGPRARTNNKQKGGWPLKRHDRAAWVNDGPGGEDHRQGQRAGGGQAGSGVTQVRSRTGGGGSGPADRGQREDQRG
eukprot:5981891-Heterocapsa_arctica.AAC.1